MALFINDKVKQAQLIPKENHDYMLANKWFMVTKNNCVIPSSLTFPLDYIIDVYGNINVHNIAA